MATYIDIHTGFVDATEEQLRAAQVGLLRIQGDEGVRFEHAWLDPEFGKLFCLSTAPSKEAVMRIHDRSGHPTSEVYEVSLELKS
jgi:hypothetical protein